MASSIHPYRWEKKVADAILSQSPGDLSMLDLTSKERAILGILKYPYFGRFLLIPMAPGLQKS